MIDLFLPVSDACRIAIPPAHRRPIAVVGSGAIMTTAHLPAYRGAGLEVVGVTDIDESRARAAAKEFEIDRVYRDVAELLADDRVEVVDIAVPAAHQPGIVRQALRAGRHVLGQKPFAPTPEIALELVELADAANRVLAVNQQLRFDEGIAAAHRMVELGWIGEVTAVSIDVNIWTEWRSWPWMLETDRLEIMNHSIHYHDAVRWFLGEPSIVFCAAGRTPGQAPAGETRTITTTLYESGARAIVHANHENGNGDDEARFRIDGSHGAIRGTLGLLYDYPHGRPDTLEISSSVVPTDGWIPYPVTRRWIPDAFAGPMAGLLAAAAGGPEPRTSARDNVGTLRLAEALYQSIATGEAQRMPTGTR